MKRLGHTRSASGGGDIRYFGHRRRKSDFHPKKDINEALSGKAEKYLGPMTHRRRKSEGYIDHDYNKIFDRGDSSGSSSSLDSLTSLQNIEDIKSDNSDVLLSEQEDEALPLNSCASIGFPQSTNLKASITKQNIDTKRPPLLSPLSLDASDVESYTKGTTKRTNSLRRDPPKILVNRVPPAGIDRLPSAMRPPLQRRGHCRSISHGGTSAQASIFHPAVAVKTENYTNILSATSGKQNNTSPQTTEKNKVHTERSSNESESIQTQVQKQPTNFSELEKQAQQIQPIHALPSALKKSSAFPATHRRVFSHGQITFSSPLNTMGETIITQSELPPSDTCSNTINSKLYKNEECQVPKTSSHMPPTAFKKGHRRGDSKTDFILPPGHEERERKRALQRSGSHRGATINNEYIDRAETVQEVGGHSTVDPSKAPSAHGSLHSAHKRHTRADSYSFSFRGHSRQASRTDSIYTLRGQSATSVIPTTTILKEKLFFWNRCSRKSKNGTELNTAANGNNSLSLNSNGMDKNTHQDFNYESSKSIRTVVPNHVIPSDVPQEKHPNAAYANNFIRTTKYTVLTFLPKNLFEQFHRFANLYFLFIVLLNWVPSINAFGKEISMLPVIFVLGVTAIKDAFEDRRRFISDKRVNNSTCRIYKSSIGRYIKCSWKDIKVGDLVHLSCNEMIPADILILRSSDDHGLCYIDTQNLDGEANLKQREVPRGFADNTFQPQDFRSHLECDTPTTKIYKFHGCLVDSSGRRTPVGKDNLVLRECILKNTDFVEGIVVYAGHESKAMMNNGGPRHKISKLETKMNIAVIWCVVTLVLLCFIGAVGSGLWIESFEGVSVPFINFGGTDPCCENGVYSSYQGFLTFWTFVIILQVIIPLSLYVTIECTKLLQVYLMHEDIQLYDAIYDKRVECKALNIPEELGQVQYMFCDKTGTLTENKMIFKRCTIGGSDFAHKSFSRVSNLGIQSPDSSCVKDNQSGRAIIPVNPILSERLNSIDRQILINGTDTKITKDKQAEQVQDFFLLLSVCNTVIVAKHPHHDQMNASGVICGSSNNSIAPSINLPGGSSNDRLKRNDSSSTNMEYNQERNRRACTEVNETISNDIQWNSENEQNFSPDTPPVSILSTATIETAMSESTNSSLTTAPLQPEPSLATPTPTVKFENINTDREKVSLNKQRSKLLDIFPNFARRSLSPIPSSPEEQPSTPVNGTIDEDAKSQIVSRPKHLQLPGIFSKLLAATSSVSLGKLHSRSPTPTPSDFRPIYEAESPDELALIDAAYAYNCKLLRRSPTSAVVYLPGEGMIDFEVLHVLPFDSVRKRMSIILRHPVSKEKILFCKGADSSMISRLQTPVPKSNEDIEIQKTVQNLNSYGKEGLRTLVMAKKILDEDEYQEWLVEHTIAENSLHQRDRLLFESYNKIEWDMILLGATGIEDKLQDGVPESISNLRKAGIVVWVLTGDKQETAINIAYSCKLFSQDMEIIKLNARSRDAADRIIQFHLDALDNEAKSTDGCNTATTTNRINFTSINNRRLWKKWKRFSSSVANSEVGTNKTLSNNGTTVNKALVIDGKTLIYVLDKRARLQEKFLQLASKCNSVLCCRATPLQKAFIVRLIKDELKMHTLAIGDGANDVPMIQTADVGIGISAGQEGMQAVMASDFAISRFKFIQRLLLVHGHWNYDRLARMILYFFYKNSAFVFVCFWFQLYCGFSGAVMIDQMYLMLYNLVFTSIPPLAIGVFDQDAPDSLLESNPQLYKQGRLGQIYRAYSFWLNMADAVYQSLIIFFFAVGTYQKSTVGIWEFGTTMCTQCLIVMSLHVAIEIKSWTIVHITSILLSIVAYFIFALLYNGLCVDCSGLQNPFWVMQHCMGTANFWLVCLITAVIAVLPRFCGRVFECTIWPNSVTKAMIVKNNCSKITGYTETQKDVQIGESSSVAFASSRSDSIASRHRGGSQDTELSAINP